MMTPGVRKIALTMHVTSSVGWLGAVVAFLALAIAGVTSSDPQIARAAYVAMHLTTWFVIVPLCLAALSTGVVQSLGTTWGLFDHYWVVTKLLLTVVATFLLFVHTQPIDHVAAVAAKTTLTVADLRQARFQLIGDACAALFVLLVTTTLSVYKPWGLTAYGLRKQVALTGSARRAVAPPVVPWGRYILLGMIGLLLLGLLSHLARGGMHAH